MTQVSFLVAGVQKGGTSALFQHLRDVPALQLPDVKEAHHFDDEERVDWSMPDHAAYHALFREDGRLWGEATPIYLYWPNALERIARYNPAMRLILIFRDPVERAWSHWKMEYSKGKERLPFAEAIRQGRARMADAQPYRHVHRVWSYVERGFYGRQLAHALDLFPREQLLLLRSRDLAHDPDRTIRTACAFLGVDAPETITPHRVRMAKDMAYPSDLTAEDVAELQRSYQEDQRLFAKLAGFGFHSDS